MREIDLKELFEQNRHAEKMSKKELKKFAELTLGLHKKPAILNH
jgi:hypothetical protein